MQSKIHFISGLPRSGSTLLAAILKQNPRFVAGMTSPVATVFRAVEDATSVRQETTVFLSEEQRAAVLKGIFEAYYKASLEDRVIFDTSRMWCARVHVLNRLFPGFKMICCVRELGWIMDSFERIYRKNDQKLSAIYNFDSSGTVYSRTLMLAASNGVVGYALDALKEAYFSDLTKQLLIVDYDDLCRNPEKTLDRVYNFIGEEGFPHDFDHVEYNAGEFDRQLGAEGLHDVKGRVEVKTRKSILPPDLFNRFANDNFWRFK